jgi:hypothetical protein
MNLHPGLQNNEPPRSPLTVPCPRCDSEMIAAVREPLASQLKVRAGRGAAPVTTLRLAVWRCVTCGVESPRFS